MTRYSVRTLGQDGIDAAARALAVAFAQDPVFRFICPDQDRDERVWRILATYDHAGSLTQAAADPSAGDRVAGVAVWDPPGYKPSFLSQLMAGPQYLRVLGRDARKAAQTGNWLKQNRPEAPHWYLAHLGAVEGGKGVGSALLEFQLSAIDGGEVRTAYLESSNERNLPLYERYGFEVTAQLSDGPTGMPPVWAMLRTPR